ncbi:MULTISPECIES: carbohydrate ABC transporter permease [unclassified Sphaerochaeta]|jgi:multiple sugar transport system permease protein|uniref:carbohydrate ABC transporter permease n=1 Tax=unclassified Sphaerochaeta TaxID=2637943 RepID=UPI0025F1C145|nr:sugar ABC transporter permease [Sphaerochaeta sp. UBA5856]
MKRLNAQQKSESLAAYICLFPSVIGLVFLTYLPLLSVCVLGFFKWGKGAPDPVFVGLDNYIRLFTRDPYFHDSLQVTLHFSLLSVVMSMVYSLFIAMLLNRRIRGRLFFRAVYYLPYVLPAMAVYIGWSWLYESNFGLFNYILSLLGFSKVKFLADSSLVVPSLSIIAVWLSGNLIVIFLAGLQNVPKVYHDAAEIDGANSFQRFIHITVPCMTPIIFYNLLMALITNMQIVTPALALTGGGPGNASTFMTYLMYRYAFVSNQLGYAGAISFIFFVIIALVTALLFSTSKGWIFYEGERA